MISKFRNIHVAVLSLLLVLGAIQIIWSYPQLPARVATHFGADGAADGWSTRNSFTLLYVFMLGGLALLFLLIVLFIHRIPSKLINMPAKDYWLAPERREATLALVSRQLLAMGNATLCFMLLLFKFTIDANLVSEMEPKLGIGTWVAVGAYLVFTLGWIVAFFWMLRPPKHSG